MGIPLQRGRDFLEEEQAARKLRVIVNEELARRFFPGEDATGKSVDSLRQKARMEIVGVAGNVRHRNLWDPLLGRTFKLAALGALAGVLPRRSRWPDCWQASCSR